MKEIARKIYLLRVLHNYTQQYVAEKLNVSASTYVSMEQGVVKIHYNRLEEILAIYELTLNNFFSFSEDDILNVIRGKCVVTPNMNASVYPYLITKMENLNKVLFQIVQMNVEGIQDKTRRLPPGAK